MCSQLHKYILRLCHIYVYHIQHFHTARRGVSFLRVQRLVFIATNVENLFVSGSLFCETNSPAEAETTSSLRGRGTRGPDPAGDGK